jgi:hypothetical protein
MRSSRNLKIFIKLCEEYAFFLHEEGLNFREKTYLGAPKGWEEFWDDYDRLGLENVEDDFEYTTSLGDLIEYKDGSILINKI